jgi:hypothetical protein
MRILFRSLALLSAVALPLAAHATTYTGTAVFTDLTHPSNVTGSFASSPFTFNDPTTTSITDLLTVTSNGNAEGDELQITVSFTAPGTGTGTLTGDADINGFAQSDGSIQWDLTSDIFTLSNGSVIKLALPSDHLNLHGCGEGEDRCSCPEDKLCGSQNLTIKVTTNDPPVATTPEPSSLALLGTGVLSLAGLVRRKIAL